MFRNILIYTILFSLPILSFAKESYEDDFESGVKNFKQKNYQSALKHFKKAHLSGMKKSVLYFNIAATYYKLGDYSKAEKNFKYLVKDNKFRQIAFYNLGLIAEKRKDKNSAVNWYKKSVKNNKNKNITELANIQLDKLLKRKTAKKDKTKASISLALGNDDNVTRETSGSPSNQSDTYIELFAYIKTAITPKINLKGTLYRINYNTLSTEDYNFYSAGLDYLIKTKGWRFVPEVSLTKSSLNNNSYQSIIDYKLTGKRKINNTARLALRYRYSDIDSENTFYDYLQGQRQQLRVDYKNKTNPGQLRLRYQLETNDRQNRLVKNYSPTRHTFRARLKHKLNSNWGLSEEFAYRISDYDAAAGVTRKDKRLRLRIVANRKIKKDWSAGFRYTYTDNDSNIASEDYKRNNIQIYSNWDF